MANGVCFGCKVSDVLVLGKVLILPHEGFSEVRDDILQILLLVIFANDLYPIEEGLLCIVEL